MTFWNGVAEISTTLKDPKDFDSTNPFLLPLIAVALGPSFPASFFMFPIFFSFPSLPFESRIAFYKYPPVLEN